MKKDVVVRIERVCEEIGELELSGIKLEEPNHRLLDVSDMDFDRHISMQPAAIAYYGALLKEAGRNLAIMKRAFDRWERKMFAQAKAGLASDKKATVEDIKAEVIIRNEAELVSWDDKLDKLQEAHDTLASWFEAWRHKSFSMREYAGIVEDERWNVNPSMAAGHGFENGAQEKIPVSERIRHVRDIMKRRREAKTEAGHDLR